MGERVTYLYEVIYLEYEQALELPYGLPIVRADQEQQANTSDGLGGDA